MVKILARQLSIVTVAKNSLVSWFGSAEFFQAPLALRACSITLSKITVTNYHYRPYTLTTIAMLDKFTTDRYGR
jgi:hypothetical protein